MLNGQRRRLGRGEEGWGSEEVYPAASWPKLPACLKIRARARKEKRLKTYKIIMTILFF
jgi:hypothetical protein